MASEMPSLEATQAQFACRPSLSVVVQVIIYLDNLCTFATQDPVRSVPVAHLAVLAGRMSASTA